MLVLLLSLVLNRLPAGVDDDDDGLLEEDEKRSFTPRSLPNRFTLACNAFFATKSILLSLPVVGSRKYCVVADVAIVCAHSLPLSLSPFLP